MHGVYDFVRATHEFFCGVYGAVRGVFRIVRGVFGIFFLIPKKIEKDKKNENISILFGFRIFRYFRVLSESK